MQSAPLRVVDGASKRRGIGDAREPSAQQTSPWKCAAGASASVKCRGSRGARRSPGADGHPKDRLASVFNQHEGEKRHAELREEVARAAEPERGRRTVPELPKV